MMLEILIIVVFISMCRNKFISKAIKTLISCGMLTSNYFSARKAINEIVIKQIFFVSGTTVLNNNGAV